MNVPDGAGCLQGTVVGFRGGRTLTVTVSAGLGLMPPSFTVSENTRCPAGAVKVGLERCRCSASPWHGPGVGQGRVSLGRRPAAFQRHRGARLHLRSSPASAVDVSAARTLWEASPVVQGQGAHGVVGVGVAASVAPFSRKTWCRRCPRPFAATTRRSPVPRPAPCRRSGWRCRSPRRRPSSCGCWSGPSSAPTDRRREGGAVAVTGGGAAQRHRGAGGLGPGVGEGRVRLGRRRRWSWCERC